MASERITFRARKTWSGKEKTSHHGTVRSRGLEALDFTSTSTPHTRGVPVALKKRKLKGEATAPQVGSINDSSDILINVEGVVQGAKEEKSLACETLVSADTKEQMVIVKEKTVLQFSLPAKSLLGPDVLGHAIIHLKESDPKLKAVIDSHDLPVFQTCNSPFTSLARSIVYQQLATNAAAAIYRRLVSLCGGEDSIKPDTILHIAAPEFRSIGISARKASYLHDLARNFVEGNLSDAAILLMEDGKLMPSLTAVKGIGTWSVHMFMIFALHRPDVLPVGDLAVRKGFQKLYNLKSLPSPVEMEQLAASWRPFRSLGSWYMWRLIGTKAPVVISVKEG